MLGPTKPGGARTCPHCGQKFAIAADKKLALVVAVGTAALGFFLLRPIPYVGPILWGLVPVTLTYISAARLQKIEP